MKKYLLLLLIAAFAASCNDMKDSCRQTPVTYTVTFESNGGSEIAPVTANGGETVAEPTEPTRPEYVFYGWFTDNITFRDEVVFPLTVTEDVTLYVRWVLELAFP